MSHAAWLKRNDSFYTIIVWVIFFTYWIWSLFLQLFVIIQFGLFELHKKYFHCKRMYRQNLRSILDPTSFCNQDFWKFLEDLSLQYRDNPSSVSLERFYLYEIFSNFRMASLGSTKFVVRMDRSVAKNHPPGPMNPWHLLKCLILGLTTGLHLRTSL